MTSEPYCASAPALARLLVWPLPKVVDVEVNVVPVEHPAPKIWQKTESSAFFMSVV